MTKLRDACALALQEVREAVDKMRASALTFVPQATAAAFVPGDPPAHAPSVDPPPTVATAGFVAAQLQGGGSWRAPSYVPLGRDAGHGPTVERGRSCSTAPAFGRQLTHDGQ
jgi:hypothetical protein